MVHRLRFRLHRPRQPQCYSCQVSCSRLNTSFRCLLRFIPSVRVGAVPYVSLYVTDSENIMGRIPLSSRKVRTLIQTRMRLTCPSTSTRSYSRSPHWSFGPCPR